MSTKASNPKEAFGSAKVPVGLVPDSAIVELSLAFLEGALKYGRYNWRIAGVRASTYNDAMERHRKRWWNGQDRDPATKVRELASVMACCAILIDAELVGKLNDDRPPRADLNKLLDDAMFNVAHLKELFKGYSPKQFTIADSDPTESEMTAANNGDPGIATTVNLTSDLCAECHGRIPFHLTACRLGGLPGHPGHARHDSDFPGAH